MKRRTAIITTIVAFIVPFLLLGTYALSSLSHTPVREANTTPQSKYDVGPPDASELLELVNAERAKYGVAPLVMDDRLNQSAQMKADDMVTYNYFSHINHDGRHGYQYVFDTAPGTCTQAGENIQATPNGTSRTAFNRWVNSKSHHDAMINPKNTHTGFGVSHDDYLKASEVDPSLHYNGGNSSNVYISVEHFCVAR